MGFPIGAPLEPSPYLQAFRDIWLQIYRGHDLDLLGSRDVIGHVTIWCPFALYSISYRRSIVTDSLSPAVFEVLGPKHIGVTTLTFQGHVTSSITWRFDSPYRVSYWCSIGTKSISPSVSEIFGSKYIGVTTLTFWVTWRHWSCDHLMLHIAFPIGVPL